MTFSIVKFRISLKIWTNMILIMILMLFYKWMFSSVQSWWCRQHCTYRMPPASAVHRVNPDTNTGAVHIFLNQQFTFFRSVCVCFFVIIILNLIFLSCPGLGLTLMLGTEYEKKKQKLLQELQLDYKHYISQVWKWVDKNVPSVQHGWVFPVIEYLFFPQKSHVKVSKRLSQTPSVSLPIDEHLSAKVRLPQQHQDTETPGLHVVQVEVPQWCFHFRRKIKKQVCDF